MKRSVAILGPTPQFVRWAIELPCALRDLEGGDLPDRSFRQLRSLREYSLGVIEGRVFDGFCLHPSSNSTEPEECRGFAEDEVLEPHGGASVIAGHCTNCPANALSRSRPNVWAGCYGWLPAKGSFSFEAMLRSPVNPESCMESNSSQLDTDLIELFERASGEPVLLKTFALEFDSTTPRWYGVWKSPRLSPRQSAVLLNIFEAIQNEVASGGQDKFANLVQFYDALRCCVDNELTMHAELVPPGHSDGQTWTIFDHCPECRLKMEPSSDQQRCSSCGRFGNPHGQRKSKVLGLRPYVQLVGVLGKEKALEFMNRFEARHEK